MAKLNKSIDTGKLNVDNDRDSEEIKSKNSIDDSREEEKIETPPDPRTIWAVQRFFLFSLILTVFKIYVTVIAGDYQSLNVISIDAVIDLVVSGMGIYLIQLQRKVFERVNMGTQEIKVNQNGVIGIASIQGLIFSIGGITVLIQSIGKMIQRNTVPTYYQVNSIVPPSSFSLLSGLILAGIVSANYAMYVKNKNDSEAIDNVALKSITSNLLIDIIVTMVAWIILLLTPFSPWVWFIFDPLVGIFIGIWMFLLGIQYLKPVMKLIAVYLEEERKKLEMNRQG